MNACNFGVTIGVLAFLGLMVLLILDALFDNITSIQHRKYVVMGDIGFSGKHVDIIGIVHVFCFFY